MQAPTSVSPKRRPISISIPAFPRVFEKLSGRLPSGSCDALRLPGEAPVKSPSCVRHVQENFWRREALSKFAAQPLAKRNESGGAHRIDIAQCAAGEGREAKADDRTNVRLARIGDDAILDRPRGLDCLGHEKPLFEFADIETVRIELRALKRVETRPKGLGPLRGIIVKTLAVFAPLPAMTGDHRHEQTLLG